MATLYRAETTLQHILGMNVGDELQLAGGDLPDYTEDDAGKALQVNQAGTGLEWGPGVPSYTSSDVGKVLTVGEGPEQTQTVTVIPEQTVEFTADVVFLSNADAYYNTEDGAEVTYIINGSSYKATKQTDIIIQVTPNGLYYEILAGKGGSVTFEALNDNVPGHEGDATPVPGTYTISATAVTSVSTVAPVWDAPSAGEAFPQLFIVPNDDSMTSAKLTNPDGTTVDASIQSGTYYCGFYGTIFPVKIVNNGISGGFVEGNSITFHVAENSLTAVGFMQNFQRLPFGPVSNLTVTIVNYTLTPAT